MRQNLTIVCLLAVAIAVGAVACGQDEGPFSPSGQNPGLNEATVTINGVQLLKAPAGLRLSGSKTRTIGSSGGEIEIDGAELDVPSGALDGNVEITMAHAQDLWAWDFGPDGLQFNSPAELEIDITVAQLTEIGVDPADIAVAVATNGYSNDWQILGGEYDPEDGELELPVGHFSRYALCVE